MQKHVVMWNEYMVHNVDTISVISRDFQAYTRFHTLFRMFNKRSFCQWQGFSQGFNCYFRGSF